MRIWSVTNGLAGMRAQAAGVSRALGEILGADVLEKTVRSGGRIEQAEGDLPPDIAVACGSSAALPTLRLKRRFGTFTVFTQRPFFGQSFFDAVLRPRHDGPGGKNTLAITGSVGPVSGAVLQARREKALARFAGAQSPRIGVLLGGANRAFSFAPEDCARVRDAVVQMRAESGGTILATASRRTGADNIHVLGDGFLWEDGGDNPYLDILAAADILAVTADSVNMLSEACSSGRPVVIFPPVLRPGWRSGRAAVKFRNFHAELESRGLARMLPVAGGNLRGWEAWRETWKSPGLDETARAAEWLAGKIRARQ